MPSTEQKENPPKQKHQFLLHIQGLRTLAIAGVLLFHSWPTFFYGGRLGVDVFFVISGFLMAKILSAAPINLPNILQFYSRRIHRIVPIYLVILICTFIAGQTLFIQTDFQQLRDDFVWSMLFASNIQAFFQESDYFNMIFKFVTRLLLHTWSLAVEIQFYLLVPFLFAAIFWLVKKWGQNGRGGFCTEKMKICTIFLFAIMLPSWALQIGLWLFVDGGVSIAFAMLFCRLWQFAAGMIAFFMSKETQSKAKIKPNTDSFPAIYCEPLEPPTAALAYGTNQQEQQSTSSSIINSTNHILLPSANSIGGIEEQRKNKFLHFIWTTVTLLLIILLIAIMVMPAFVHRIFINSLFGIELGPPYEMFLRTMVILIIMFVIYLLRNNKNDEFSVASFLLDNRLSVHFGNLSYVLYLVHWPLLQFVKYYFFIEQPGIWDGCAILVSAILLSELLDRLVDANFRRIKSKLDVMKLTIGLYVLCAMLLLPTYHSVNFENLPINTKIMFKGKALEPNSYGQNGPTQSATFAFYLIEALNNEKVNENNGIGNLAQHLTRFEKIKTNELLRIVSTMSDSRLSLIEGEQYTERFSTNTTGCPQCKVLREFEWFARIAERERKGKGNETFLAIGNSYLELLDHEMMIALEDHYSQFYTYAIFFCSPFHTDQKYYPKKSKENPWIYRYEVCDSFAKSAQNAIAIIQPDVLILSFRWYHSYFPAESNSPEFHASMISSILDFVEFAQKYVKRRIFFSLPSVEFKKGNTLELSKRLWLNKPLDTLNIQTERDHNQPNQWILDGLDAANFSSKCPICVLYYLSKVFCDNEICNYFDPKTDLAYFFDECHLSLHGQRKIRPYLRELINE